jgi:biopolymer transport protein ExbD
MKRFHDLSHLPLPSRSLDAAALGILLVLAVGIFILQSRFFLSSGWNIELPTNFSSLDGAISTFDRVFVKDVGHAIFHGEILPPDALADRLLAREDWDGSALLIQCDRRAPLEALLQVADAAKRAQIGSIQIAISSPSISPTLPSAAAIFYPHEHSHRPPFPRPVKPVPEEDSSQFTFVDSKFQLISEGEMEAMLLHRNCFRSLLP